MPRDRNQLRGGKREERRRAAIQRALAAGQSSADFGENIPEEYLEYTATSSGHTTLEPPSTSTSERQRSPQQGKGTKRDRDHSEPAVRDELHSVRNCQSSPDAGPRESDFYSPSESPTQDPPRSPSQSPVRVRAPLDQVCADKPVLAVDLHNTLDQGRKYSKSQPIPESSILALVNLSKVFTIWILTFVGTEGKYSAERRNQAARVRDFIASRLNLSACDGPPKPGHISLQICDSRCGELGKAVLCRNFGVYFIVDDCKEICEECESYGILPFQITFSRSSGNKRGRSRVYQSFDNLITQNFKDFPECAEEILHFWSSHRLFERWLEATDLIWERRSRNSPYLGRGGAAY